MSTREPDHVQIHMLTSYPATLLNRDDTGLAKRIPFGGVMRTRVSSQCLKKHWRDSGTVRALGEAAHRSTRIYEQLIADHLISQESASEDEASAISQLLIESTLDTKPADDKKGRPVRTGQLVVLTPAEVGYLQQLAADVLSSVRSEGVEVSSAKDVKKVWKLPADVKKTLEALPASIDTALFGRFVTSDLFARVDSAVGVAHAFTTHEEASETDYFTAVDTLNVDDAGAGLIQEAELTTGVYYLYAVVDMNQLRDNLGAEADRAEDIGRTLALAMATVSPGAKVGSTAPFAYAECVALERGGALPRSLANAFLSPVSGAGHEVMTESVRRLFDYYTRLAQMYGTDDCSLHVSTIHSVPEGFVQVPLAHALSTVFPS